MADLTVTAGNVEWISGPVGFGVAGETLTRGEPVWRKWDDGEQVYACDASRLDSSYCDGICLTDASSGENMSYARDGAKIHTGATMTAGEFYGVSATAGGIAPLDDLTTSEYMTKLFVAETTNYAVLNILVTGRKHAADSSGDLTRTVADVGLVYAPPLGTEGVARPAIKVAQAGTPLTIGWPLYLKHNDLGGEVFACDASALGTSGVVGIALNGPATGDVYYATDGAIVDLGSTLTAGQIYVISTTTNAIMPYSDLGTGDYIGVVGGSVSTRHLLIKTDTQGITAP